MHVGGAVHIVWGEGGSTRALVVFVRCAVCGVRWARVRWARVRQARDGHTARVDGARDRSCVPRTARAHPGCDAHPRLCDAHDGRALSSLKVLGEGGEDARDDEGRAVAAEHAEPKAHGPRRRAEAQDLEAHQTVHHVGTAHQHGSEQEAEAHARAIKDDAARRGDEVAHARRDTDQLLLPFFQV
jgi:hypothetical protein